MDEKVVLLMDQISGNILQSFLALIYTGKSSSLRTSKEQAELKNLCLQLKLKSADSICPSSPLTSDDSVLPGFKEVELPESYATTTSSFLLPPVQKSHVPPDDFKVEPHDLADAENGDYFDEFVEVDTEDSGVKTRSGDSPIYFNTMEK